MKISSIIGRRVYLGIPYTINPELSYQTSIRIAAHLMQHAAIVFSPVIHTHPIANFLETDWGWETWKSQDIPWVKLCEVMAVVTLPEWQKSVGLAEEIKISRSLRHPIVFIDPDTMKIRWE